MRLTALASAAILILTSACNPSTAPVSSVDPLAPLASAVSPTHPVGVIDVAVTLPGRPYGIAISKSGAIVLTTQIGLDQVARANLPNRSFGTFIPVGVAPPHVAINDAETRAYVPNQLSADLSVIDLATNSELARLPLAGEGYNVATHQASGIVYVTTNIGRVYLISMATNSKVDSFDIAPANNGLAFSGNRLYISSILGGTVTVYNTLSRTVGRTLVTGGKPQRMAINQSVNELYIANETSGLDIWSLTTNTRIRTVPMDAYGLALSPDGNRIYVSGARTGIVTIVNRATRAVERQLNVGGVPRNIAFTPTGTRAVVTNEAGYVTWIR